MLCFAAQALLGVTPGAAQEDEFCGFEDAGLQAAPIVPNVGQVNALFILARFRDDNRASWTDEWPIDPSATSWDQLPAWADSLVESDANPGPPAVDGSISDLLHYMSQGKLRFRGEVYPQVVVLPDVSTFGSSGLSASRRAAMDSVDATGFITSDFARNNPNTLDYVVVLFRGFRHFGDCIDSCATGTPCTADCAAVVDSIRASTGATGGGFSHTLPTSGRLVSPYLQSFAQGYGFRVAKEDYPNGQAGTLQLPTSPADTCRCEADIQYPVAVHGLRVYRQVIVHEIGHSLYQNSTLLSYANHIWSMAYWDIMFSNGSGAVMSGAARYLLGWLDPIRIPADTEATVTIYDSTIEGAPSFTSARTDSTCVVIYPLGASDSSQVFVLENRRHSTVYADSWSGPNGYLAQGQPGSGLLVTHVNWGGPDWEASCTVNPEENAHLNHRLNVEVASGMWDETFRPDPVAGRSRISSRGTVGNNWGYYCAQNIADSTDAFKPGVNTLFAPYTTPSTNLYGTGADAQRQIVPTGLAVMNIREGPDSSYTFDIKWNQSAEETSGDVTWTDQVILTEDFTIATGDTVTVAEDARVLVRADSALVGREGVDLKRVEFGIEGHLDFEHEPLQLGDRFIASSQDVSLRIGPYANADSLITGDGPQPADHYGLRLRRGGTLGQHNATIKDALYAIAVEDTLFPAYSFDGGSHTIKLENNQFQFGFDRDVVVPQDSTLTLKAGWKLGFGTRAGGADQENLGDYPTLAELLVRGNVDFQGANYYNPVSLLAAQFPYDAPTATGWWGGMKVDAYPPSGGVCADSRVVDFTLFRDAKIGIAHLDSCSMILNWPLFANNEDADLYFDRDVRIPEGRFWDLRAPTRVVFEADSSAWDFTGGEPGRVDIFELGNVEMRRPESVASPDDFIWFQSTAMDSVNGDDWGTLLLYPSAGRCAIEDADFGFAVNPLFLWAPDSLSVVANTRVHHFAATGIWVLGTPYQGAVIDSCVVERGVGLLESKGDIGILLDQADEVNLVETEVSLEGLDKSTGGTGVILVWGKNFCQTTPQDHQTVVLQDNRFFGPLSPQSGTAYAGLKLDWVCGSQDREIDILENWIEGWKHVGMEYVQTADVQVNCNLVRGGNNAVDVYRDSDPTGTSLRFRENDLEAITLSTSTFVLRTNDAIKVKLGPNQSDRGKNNLVVRGTSGASFIYDSDAQAADTLNARNNHWYVDVSGTRSLLDDENDIRARLAPTGYSIDVTGFYEFAQAICRPDSTGTRARPRHEPVGDVARSSAGVDTHSEEIRLHLSQARPNPANGGVTLALSVPTGATGEYVLDVFDIRGRRVLCSPRHVSEPGRYEIAWSGQEAGRPVAAGIYFLRLQGPAGFSEIRKVTVVR